MAPGRIAHLPGGGTRETRPLAVDPAGELAHEFFSDLLAPGPHRPAAGAELSAGVASLAGQATLLRSPGGQLLEVAFAVHGPATERTYRLADAALATFDARVRDGSAPELALLRVLRNGGGVGREDARLRTRPGGLAFDLASGALVPIGRGEARERQAEDGALRLGVAIFGNLPGHYFAAACTLTVATAPQAGEAASWTLAFALPPHLAGLLPELLDLPQLGLTRDAALAGAAAGGAVLTWQATPARRREVPVGLRGLDDLLAWLEETPPSFERAAWELESLAFAQP